tara:strand:- start:26038 stop:26400 length:363 start_codon:yes stop_codon:yes gene_type:complete
METESVSVLDFTLFKHSEKSFLAALDEAGISHGRVHMFSSRLQASGIVESISALSEAMPWNAIAKIIVAWIEAKKSREIIIKTESGTTIHVKGYSAKDVQKMLPKSVNIMVIDTEPDSEI